MFRGSAGYREKHIVRTDSEKGGGDGDVDIESLESEWMVALRVSSELLQSGALGLTDLIGLDTL